MAAVPRVREGRTDLWVGIDRSALELKPWWRIKAGQSWFLYDLSGGTNPPVILGSEAAIVEMRKPGDKLFSPETGQALQVAAVLERSGTSDDNAFFVPLATAQKMFNQAGRLTAVAIRLRDPARMREVVERLERIPGAQVVTMTEMTGVFLNLLGTVRTFVLAIAALAITVSALSLFNTLLAGVVERTSELAVLRAIGASRAQIFTLLTVESLALTASGGLMGLIFAASLGPRIETWVRRLAPLAPSEPLLTLTAGVTVECLAIAVAAGLLAAVYPAWRASRLQPALATRNE
jgi:ABC-type lipoprotein release transport system permease subunit